MNENGLLNLKWSVFSQLDSINVLNAYLIACPSDYAIGFVAFFFLLGKIVLESKTADATFIYVLDS